MQNLKMLEKLEKYDAVDVSIFPKNQDGDYILPEYVDGVDYCDADTEQWIWSIGVHNGTGQILASTTGKFYQNPEYKCVWLR